MRRLETQDGANPGPTGVNAEASQNQGNSGGFGVGKGSPVSACEHPVTESDVTVRAIVESGHAQNDTLRPWPRPDPLRFPEGIHGSGGSLSLHCGRNPAAAVQDRPGPAI